MGRDILVDGYNIIRNDAEFQRVAAINMATARANLITKLVSRYRHTPHQVIVVFDGDGKHEEVSHDRRVRIIFSRHNETADSVIMRLSAEARADGREVEMYSNDGEIRHVVSTHGGNVYTTQHLTQHLNAPPRDVAKRARHRMAMRKKYGLDPSYDPDDEPEPQRPKKGKKKSSRRYY